MSIIDGLRRMFGWPIPPPAERTPYVGRRQTRTGKLRAAAGEVNYDSLRRRPVDRRVLDLPDLSPSAKAVYRYLARIADDEGYCFPFHDTIARRTELSRSTVERALHELAGRDLVTWQQRVSRRGQSSNVYQVHRRDDVTESYSAP